MDASTCLEKNIFILPRISKGEADVDDAIDDDDDDEYALSISI